MRNSHHAQLEFLDSRLKLGVEDGFSGWQTFLELTERRNLFVHNGGCVNNTYINNSKKYGFKLYSECKEGDYLAASDDYIGESLDCLYELTERIAQASARRLFPECLEEADGSLNNRTVDLMSDERWSLAERIFEFTLGIPEQFRSGAEFRYYSLINLCVALKFSGKEFSERLREVDWNPMHPKYHFAIAVLEDRFDDAADLMKSEAVLNEVPKENFIDWPLLRSFRETPQFIKAFDEIFSSDDKEKLMQEARELIDAEQECEENLTADTELEPDDQLVQDGVLIGQEDD